MTMPVECALLSSSLSLTRSPRRPAAEDERVHGNTKLVDQPVRYQVSGEIGAAEQEDVLGALALQSRDRTGHLRVEYLRVVPVGALQRAREHVFRQRVHEVGDLAGGARPMIRHQLVGDAAEHQPAGGLQLPDRQPLQFLAPDVEVPGYVAVYAFHEAVERHQVPHDQLRHAASPLLALCNWLYPEITGAILQVVFVDAIDDNGWRVLPSPCGKGLGVGVPQAQLPAWTRLPNSPPQGEREYIT